MAIKFKSVACVILQVTKKKATQEKRQQEQRTQKNEWITSWLQRANQSKEKDEPVDLMLFIWRKVVLGGGYIRSFPGRETSYSFPCY